MANFTVKTEFPAVRCDICHQADLFDAETGGCLRCGALVQQNAAEGTAHWSRSPALHFRFTGPGTVTGWHIFKNTMLCGLVGGGPGVLLPLLVVANAWENPVLTMFGVLTIGCSVIPALLTGFVLGKRLRETREFFPCYGFWESGGSFSCSSTLILLIVGVAAWVAVGISLNRPGLPAPIDHLFPWAVGTLLYLSLFNTIGGHLIARCLQELERENLEFFQS